MDSDQEDGMRPRGFRIHLCRLGLSCISTESWSSESDDIRVLDTTRLLAPAFMTSNTSPSEPTYTSVKPLT